MLTTVAPPRILPPSGHGGTPLTWRGLHIGNLTPNDVWRKENDSRRHLCRKYDGWGFQAQVYDSLRNRGRLRALEVFDRRTRCTFRALVEVVEAHGIRDTLNPLDGEQVFLARHFWEVEHPDGYQYPLAV